MLCSLLKDDFGATYYLIRAAACKQPWGKIEDELAMRMRKSLDSWQSKGKGAKPKAREDQIMSDFTVVIATLYLGKEWVSAGP